MGYFKSLERANSESGDRTRAMCHFMSRAGFSLADKPYHVNYVGRSNFSRVQVPFTLSNHKWSLMPRDAPLASRPPLTSTPPVLYSVT